MQNIKKYFMTLALLIIAVTGAWAADTYTITFKANNKTKTIENVTLPHTFTSVNNQGNGELDLIINDLYNQSEGWCVEIPTVSGNSNVTAGLDGSYNQYITISAPFEGNATVSAMHFYNIPISSFTYTLEISVESPAIEVKWDAATKSGTFVMPGGNVELQVEYYPESNLFLGKEALKDKANISVLNGETAVAFDDDGKSTATVTEGNTVTAKFTGKKVLGMKVAKKAANVHSITIAVDPSTNDPKATAPAMTIEFKTGETWADVAARYDWLDTYETYTVFYNDNNLMGNVHDANGGVKPNQTIDPNGSYHWGM